MPAGIGNPAVNISKSEGWELYAAKIDDLANAAGQTINITFRVGTDTGINFAGLAMCR